MCSKLLMELLSILWALQLLVCFEKLTPLYCLQLKKKSLFEMKENGVLGHFPCEMSHLNKKHQFTVLKILSKNIYASLLFAFK